MEAIHPYGCKCARRNLFAFPLGEEGTHEVGRRGSVFSKRKGDILMSRDEVFPLASIA
jgi:hypothetical protein